jgi:hypothetical protein
MMVAEQICLMSNGRKLNLCYRHRKHGQGNLPMTIAEFSTVFSGCIARVLHGEIFPNATATIGRSPVGSIDGKRQAFGNRFGQA